MTPRTQSRMVPTFPGAFTSMKGGFNDPPNEAVSGREYRLNRHFNEGGVQ